MKSAVDGLCGQEATLALLYTAAHLPCPLHVNIKHAALARCGYIFYSLYGSAINVLVDASMLKESAVFYASFKLVLGCEPIVHPMLQGRSATKRLL